METLAYVNNATHRSPVMQNSDKLSKRSQFPHVTTPLMAALVLGLGALVAHAQKTVNVSIDHNQYWNGYQWRSTGGEGWMSTLEALDLQATVSANDVVRLAPDIRMDKLFHADTAVWADDTGLSDPNPGVTVRNTFYNDLSGIAVDGDTVIFSGRLMTNGLAEPYASSIVAFIKDFDAGWGWHGMASTPLITVANGDVFYVEKVISGGGAHIQFGFEWQAPPARTNAAAASYVGNLGEILLTNSLVLDVAAITGISPSPANVRLGSNVTLVATTAGTGLTYQWSKGGVALNDGPGITGTKTNALALTNLRGDQEGVYTLVVTDTSANSATGNVSVVVYNPNWLYFDRALAPFQGWINVWSGANLISSPAPSGDAGTSPKASWGWGVNPATPLRASMDLNTDVVTLQPNTTVYDGAINSMDPAYINPDGTPAAYLEQDFFLGNNSLVGDTLVFAGYCSSNSLDPQYTATAWIKVSQDWSVEYRYDTNLVAGKPFILTVPSSATTNRSFAQFGFALWGPCNASTNPVTEGAVEVKVYSPISASRSGGSMGLEFPTVINHQYSVQYKDHITNTTWNTLATTNGTGAKITIPDATTGSQRFYRLSTQ